MSAYFMTATGTGVGKTFTTCALLHAAKHQGRESRGLKPVISGWDDSADTDTAQIIAASGNQQPIDDVSPWRFTAPLSPHRAAALEDKAINIDALAAWTKEQTSVSGLTLIETVGGVMVPLTDNKTTLDWMAALKLPAILVTGSYLGTISHTLTAMDALRSRTIPIAAIILNESDGSAVTLAEADAGLAPFIRDIPLRITQPRVTSWKEAHAIAALVKELV